MLLKRVVKSALLSEGKVRGGKGKGTLVRHVVAEMAVSFFLPLLTGKQFSLAILNTHPQDSLTRKKAYSKNRCRSAVLFALKETGVQKKFFLYLVYGTQ